MTATILIERREGAAVARAAGVDPAARDGAAALRSP